MNVDDEAILLGSTPSQVRNLTVAGLAGIHYLHAGEEGDADQIYRAHFDLAETLPLLHATGRSLMTERARAFGPRLKTGDRSLDRAWAVRSDGWDFPRLLLSREAVAEAAADCPGILEALRIQTQEERGSLLSIEIVVDGKADRIGPAITLARAVAEAAIDLCDREVRFSDARSVLAAMGTDVEAEVPVEDVETVSAALRDATSWVTGDVGRLGKQLQVRLHLSDHGLELEGSLALTWRGGDMTDHELTLEADLPQIESPSVSMVPEQKGVLGLVRRLGETVLGDESVDDAFVVRTSPEAAPMLLHARQQLAALGAVGAEVHLGGGRLKVLMREAAADVAALRAQTDASLHLWRLLSLWIAGVRDDQVDPYAYDG